jgi:hypothetical protein
MERNSLGTLRIYLGHIAATLGERFPLPALASLDLQRHITRRAAMRGTGDQCLI